MLNKKAPYGAFFLVPILFKELKPTIYAYKLDGLNTNSSSLYVSSSSIVLLVTKIESPDKLGFLRLNVIQLSNSL